MKVKDLLGASLLCLSTIGFIGNHILSRYIFTYINVGEFNRDILYLCSTTADCLKSSKYYGKEPHTSEVIKDRKETFTGLMETLRLDYAEGENCSAYFYSEVVEIIYKHLETTKYSNPQF